VLIDSSCHVVFIDSSCHVVLSTIGTRHMQTLL
jgi:hypothetical protein